MSQVPPQPQAQSVPSWALHLVQGNRHLGAAGGRGEAGQLGFGGAGGLGGGGVGSRPELLLQAAVEQEGVVALDDKQTAGEQGLWGVDGDKDIVGEEEEVASLGLEGIMLGV